jgi:hypothetical protein
MSLALPTPAGGPFDGMGLAERNRSAEDRPGGWPDWWRGPGIRDRARGRPELLWPLARGGDLWDSRPI